MNDVWGLDPIYNGFDALFYNPYGSNGSDGNIVHGVFLSVFDPGTDGEIVRR